MDFGQPKDSAKTSLFQDFFCIGNILETAIRYWRIVVIFTIIGLFTAFFITRYLIKPVYMAKSTIFAWQVSQGNERDQIASYGRMLAISSLLINDYQALLLSERVQDQVAAEVREFCGSGQEKGYWYKIGVDYQRDTRILTIKATSNLPKVAQFAANSTAKVFSETIRQVLELDNVQIIDAAKLPEKPINRSLRFNLMLGLVLGLMAGSGLALLLGLLDQTIKNPEQAGNYLKVPIMGVIPLIAGSGSKKLQNSFIFNLLDDPDQHELSEAFRLLRANLPYLVPDKSGQGRRAGHDFCRVLLVTSTIASEGKSNCVSSLAYLTAKAGKRVLLVDADLRRPTLHKVFDLPCGSGLVSYMAGECTLEEATVHSAAGIEGFDVIPSGPIPPNPSEILMSDATSQLLEEMRQRYDYIFIDTAPALFLADPMILMPLCDGVLFVVSCSNAKIGLIRKTIAQLSQISQLPLGAIVNRFDRSGPNGYYGTYRYKNYYRYYTDYMTPENPGAKAGYKNPVESASPESGKEQS